MLNIYKWKYTTELYNKLAITSDNKNQYYKGFIAQEMEQLFLHFIRYDKFLDCKVIAHFVNN